MRFSKLLAHQRVVGAPTCVASSVSMRTGLTALLAAPEPTEARSDISVVRTARHPLPGSPTRLASGTRTSVRKTSLNSASPVICLSGRTSTPGVSIGSRNIVRPWCLGTSGSVRAISWPIWALWA